MTKPFRVPVDRIAFDIGDRPGRGVYYRQDGDRETNLRKTWCKACLSEVERGKGEAWICGYIQDSGTIYYWSEFILCKKCHKEVIKLNPEKEDDFG